MSADSSSSPSPADPGDPAARPSLRSIGLRIYAPALLYGTGSGAIAGVIALSAGDLGATPAGAGLVVSMQGIGGLVGALPAGMLTARIGERRAMLAAAGLMATGLSLCLLANAVWLLGAGVGVIGTAGSVWMLARQAYIAESVPFALRARALSTLGGVNRIGMFVGPFLGAAAIARFGLSGPYALFIGIVAFAGVVILTLPDPPTKAIDVGGGSGGARAGTFRSVWQMTIESLPVLRTVGVGVVLVGAIRASRQVVIPLWGTHLDLAPETIALIFGISGAVDMLLFYPAGYLMDRFGRIWTAIPSMVLLGISMLLIPLSSDAAGLTAAAVVMGIGNGLGSGLIMTLGADLSPPGRRAEFLGAWRLCGDTGTSAGPLGLSGLIAVVSLAPAIAAMGLVGFVGAGLLAYWVPRVTRAPTMEHGQ